MILAAISGGCGEPQSECGESGVVEHDTAEIGLVSPKSLCEVIEWGDDSIGVYRVDSLKTYVDDDPFHTYAELSLQAAWKPGSAANPVIRGSGGPGGEKCQIVRSSIAEQLAVGEEIVVFLRAPDPDVNKGYYGLGSQTVFHDIGDGQFSNGVLFEGDGIALDDLEERVRAAGFDADDPDFCPEDVEPN
jgi:hypothetical protein